MFGKKTTTDTNKLTPAEIDRMTNAKNRQELLRQQSLDKLAKAAKDTVEAAKKGKGK